MKQRKITISIKELCLRIRREAITLLLCLSMAFFVLVIVMFIKDRAKKFLVSDDLYLPQLKALSCFSPAPTLFQSHCNLSTSSFNTSNANLSLRDWISSKGLWHSMNDEELMWRASIVPQIAEYPYERVPKVAFMFLTKGELPLALLWEMFFKGYEGLFSIYLHVAPELAREPPESSVFYGRRVPSKPVQWGQASMIDAERRLLANALLDMSNERFVLLSETCIPLFNFTTIYNYLINSKLSFVGSFDDTRKIGRGRYNKGMWPTISLSDWRKGSQWFEVNRKLAIEIVSDVTYYPVFREYCKPPCYMDEHYLPTLVTKLCPDINSNRTITWVDWSAGGSHPTRFTRRDISDEFLNRIRRISNCSYNSEKNSICFLFGRKFHSSTLQALLSITPRLLGFNP